MGTKHSNLDAWAYRLFRGGIRLAGLIAISVFVVVISAIDPPLVAAEEGTLVSDRTYIPTYEPKLAGNTPVIGQIFATGGDRGKYELTGITANFDNISLAHSFDLHAALHLVTNDHKPGKKFVDLEPSSPGNPVHDWRPTGVAVLDPGTRYMAVFRCSSGGVIAENCAGAGEGIGFSRGRADDDFALIPNGWTTADNLYIEDGNGNAETRRGSLGIGIQAQSAGAPYIVDNGVTMYELSASEAGGFPVRVKSDDTYGNGELIAVSVEFSEPVWVNSETTFRIQIGSSTRELVAAGGSNEEVIFATLIRSSDNDSNGVWIGNSAATLDHNPAHYITSRDDSPVNANWNHTSLGTQADHKVKGSAYRPKVTDVRVKSTPEYGDTYVRNEAIEIEARFNRAVRTSGHVSARINSEALGSNALRYAQYAEGSGSSRLVFRHLPFLDIDPDGIAIPSNALAKNGDVTMGVEGGGTIVGASRGLHARLDSRGKGEDGNHKIDVRKVGVPEVITSVNWGWEEDSPASESVEVDFHITADPGHFSEDHSLVLVLGWGHIGSSRFAIGLRTDVDKPGTDGSQGKGIIFNRWGTADTSNSSRTTGDGWTEVGDFGGPFISVRRTYDWGAGAYKVRIVQDGADDDADDAGGAGRWYAMWITDKSTGADTKLGSIKFPYSDDSAPLLRLRDNGFGSLIAIVGESSITGTNIPVLEAGMALPDASGDDGDEPNAAAVSYSLLGRGISNANVAYDAETGKVVMRVGGSTDKSTRGGTTLTGFETPELTAEFTRVPRSHNGSSDVVFRLIFSENPPLSYKTLRDHAFTVTGGSVKKASRVYTSSNQRWEIRVQPSSNDDVTVVLPATVNCWDTGAICTADGRELADGVEVTIPGPGSGS